MKVLNRKFAWTLVSAAALLGLGACKSGSEKEVWIYTSTYREVLALYEPGLKKAFPDAKIQWFQSGSENVAAKIQTELAAGKTQADLVMSSDLFFFQELSKQGHLATLGATTSARLPTENVDAAKTIAVSRFPVMIIAYNTSVPEADRPKSFKDLLNPKYKGKISMPSPMESGSALTATMFLNQMFGEDYFKGLRANDVLAAGGNGAVLARLQSGERPIGIVLMENVLQSIEKGSSAVKFVIPEEGALPIPSPMAILKGTKQPELAQQVLDWFLSDEAQATLIKGWVYSALPTSPAPANAPAWKELKLQPWSFSVFEKWGADRQKVKDMFQNTVLK